MSLYVTLYVTLSLYVTLYVTLMSLYVSVGRWWRAECRVWTGQHLGADTGTRSAAGHSADRDIVSKVEGDTVSRRGI